MPDYMEKACAHCPFRRDVRPFLRPSRAKEIAYSTENPYSDFPCHKTIGYHDDEDGGNDMSRSKTCAGWLAMSINEGAQSAPEGWEWPGDVYCDPYEMIGEYEAAAEGTWTPPTPLKSVEDGRDVEVHLEGASA